MTITEEEIEACKSPAGGWTKATLAQWGVPWPPPKGWKAALIAGEPLPVEDNAETAIEVERMLRELSVACINAGRSDIIAQVDGLIELYGGRIPTQQEIADNRIGLRNDAGGPWA